jgi:hypothetical protein
MAKEEVDRAAKERIHTRRGWRANPSLAAFRERRLRTHRRLLRQIELYKPSTMYCSLSKDTLAKGESLVVNLQFQILPQRLHQTLTRSKLTRKRPATLPLLLQSILTLPLSYL